MNKIRVKKRRDRRRRQAGQLFIILCEMSSRQPKGVKKDFELLKDLIHVLIHVLRVPNLG